MRKIKNRNEGQKGNPRGLVMKAFCAHRAIPLFFIIGFLALILTARGTSAQTDYYVDIVNGNDSISGGTSASPWKTLHYAINQLSVEFGFCSNHPCVLHVAPGVYSTANGEYNAPIEVYIDNLTIIGEGATRPVIQGDSTNWNTIAFDIRRSGVTIENLNITGFPGGYCGSGDFGTAIRVWQTGTSYIRQNEISNIGRSDCYGAGINLMGASNALVESNMIHDNYANDIQVLTTATIQNNLIYSRSLGTFSIGVYLMASSNATIYHNTIVGPNVYPMQGAGIYIASQTPAPIYDIKYNIITGLSSGILQEFSGEGPCPPLSSFTLNTSYNDVWGNETNYNSTCADHFPTYGGPTDISLDPKLAANFTLLAGSPCIDAIPLNSGDPVTDDYTGISRPQGNGFDIGAYEVQGAPLVDTDGDGIPDIYDNCPKTPNGPLMGTCVNGGYYGTQCQSDSKCGGVVGSCSMNQEDSNGDGLGDACSGGPNSTTSYTLGVASEITRQGASSLMTATFHNGTGQGILTMQPDCFNTTFTVRDLAGNIISPRDRVRKAYGIAPVALGGDLVTINKDTDSIVACDLLDLFRPEVLIPGAYTVQATYSNHIQDPANVYDIWMGAIHSTEVIMKVIPATGFYVVTPSAVGNGSIDPSNPQAVSSSGIVSFTLTPAAGYYIASVSGCGGTLNGNRYTTGPIAADCIVTATFRYYKFTGFSSPVDNPPTLNIAKGGQAIPVKWRLTDLSGNPISDPGSFSGLTSYGANCTGLGEISDPIPEDAAGGSGLQYLGNGNWQYNWKTSKSYAGTCRVMVLTLKDGAQYKADFKFK